MDFFKPNLTITVSPSLKSYRVIARVIVPNGCYMSAGAVPKAPHGYVHVPETQPITLNIVRYSGPCTMGIQVLEFTIAWLPLTSGISSVTAFVVINGEVEAVGSKPILQIRDDKVAALSSEQMAPSSGVIVRSVNGWINARPGSGGPTLITIVNVFALCLNYEFKLVDKGPFGFTGLTLLIELVATLPDACQRGIFEGPIRFEKALESSSDFDSVAVEFEGELYFDPLEVAV